MKNEQKEIGVSEVVSFITRIDEPNTWKGNDGNIIVCRKVWLLSKYANQYAGQKDMCVDFYKGNTDWPSAIDQFSVNDLVRVKYNVTSRTKEWTSADGTKSGINYQHWLTGKSIELLEKGEPEPEPEPVPEPERPARPSAPAKPSSTQNDSGKNAATGADGVWDDDVPF